MAPRTKAAPTAHPAGASDSEDDLITAAANRGPHLTGANIKKSKSNSGKTNTMPSRAAAGKGATKRKAAPNKPREILQDRTNLQPASDAEEAEDFDDDDDMADKPKAKRAKTTATRKNATVAKRGKTARPAPAMDPPYSTIPETQPEPEMTDYVEQSIEIDSADMAVAQAPTPPKYQRFAQRAPSASVAPQPRANARSVSAQPNYPFARERSGSASATERRGGDPEMRRKLNDITRKYENLQLKYESLEEIGKNDAETNFEKLKRASDQKTKDANELIASLKKELAELKKSSTSVTSETAGLQKQITTLNTSSEKITAERDDLKSKLHDSRNEVKSLEAKLMVARQQISNGAQEAKSHEAAAKSQSRNAVANLGDVSKKEAKMKENLYSDLTGLIIRAVKQKDGEDEFDCIQTGRNGTLHFHLSVGNDATTPHPRTPSGLSYEEAEFAYEPLLDDNRDRDLLDLLPDYLTEEICFPRNHAQRFYTKLVDSMTKRIVVEDE